MTMTKNAPKIAKNGHESKHHRERNPGIPLDTNVLQHIRVNKSAVERRVATIGKRRSVKKEWQAAWFMVRHSLTCSLPGKIYPG